MIQGRELSQRFHQDAVGPILRGRFPSLGYAAALIGEGSEVLGFDTEMSQDHDWGPRLNLFVLSDDLPVALEIRQALTSDLPTQFLGFPTRFAPNDDGTGRLSNEGEHRVRVCSFDAFLDSYLGYDPSRSPNSIDWLTFPEQKLLTLAEASIFHDSIGVTERLASYSYFPRDVWLFQMAAVWERIGEDEHLVGRAGYVGDEIGAKVIAARLVRDAIRLCFLMERRYAPYSKWFGTAFQQLSCAREIEPVLEEVLRAEGWEERDERLVVLYEAIAGLQNRLGLFPPRSAAAGLFYNRPFHVIHLHVQFSEALMSLVEDPELRRLADVSIIGGIDMISDRTALVSRSVWRERIKRLYS